MSNSTADEIGTGCASLFREMNGLSHSPKFGAMTAETLLDQPLGSFEIDSLSVMEFVMAVEDRFGVELNELAVNRCETVGDLVVLVRQARGV